MTETTPGQAAYEAYDRAHGVSTPRANWEFQGPGEHSAWEAAAQAAIEAAAAAGIFAVAAGDEYRVSLPGPIHLGPGIAVSGRPAGGTSFERTDVITDRVELAAAIAKLEEIRRLCQAGGQHGQVWGGKPRVAGDSVVDIILDIIGQDPKPAPELDEQRSVESLITELGKCNCPQDTDY